MSVVKCVWLYTNLQLIKLLFYKHYFCSTSGIRVGGLDRDRKSFKGHQDCDCGSFEGGQGPLCINSIIKS